MAPVAGLSAFLNNTPVAAIFIPAVEDWAKRHRLELSRLMIPLSYAGIAGGACTLIGTSTNLVVNGLIIRETGGSGIGMFELASVGLEVWLSSLAYGACRVVLLDTEGRPRVTPCTVDDLPARVHHVVFKHPDEATDNDAGEIDFARQRQIVARWRPQP